MTITGSGDMAHTVPLVPISMSFEYKSVQSLRQHSTSELLYQALYSIKRCHLCPSISIQKGLWMLKLPADQPDLKLQQEHESTQTDSRVILNVEPLKPHVQMSPEAILGSMHHSARS